MAKKADLPRYTEKHGWVGGDSRTLYAFTDRRTGQVSVHPGGGPKRKLLMRVGPEVDVRIASRSEAEEHWQNPLHMGWKVANGGGTAHARKYGPKATEKIGQTLHEWKRGTLKSSSGQKVKSQKQAIAIGISQARRSGYKVPPEPPPSHARRKSPAELDRDIAEVLGRSHATKRSPKSSGGPVILVREGGGGTTRYPQWRQYMVVSDERVATVHMKPAMLGGWNFDKVDIQKGDDWPDMSRDQIVAYKMRDDDGKTKVADDLDSSFRQKLLAKAD